MQNLDTAKSIAAKICEMLDMRNDNVAWVSSVEPLVELNTGTGEATKTFVIEVREV